MFTEFCKIGKTTVSIAEPSKARPAYYVSAIGGRVFGSASFSSRVQAYALYNRLIEEAKGY